MNTKAIFVAVPFIACAAVAQADMILFSKSGASGAVSGSMDYTFVSGSLGKLTISLTNVSPAPNGGKLTGLAFDIVSADANATASLFSKTNSNFVGMTNVSAAPFGTFDAGAALGGNWLGGGSPNGGIAVGGSATFVFNITASDASTRTAANFLGSGDDSLALRFRGFVDGGSDKMLVPSSGTLSLAAGGLVFAARRRRRNG
ncbi:MAG: hypothetical protein J0L78_16960 [Planctomycetes bacterium]|nr:hypothetical protein [Planctomycetota bacterium]